MPESEGMVFEAACGYFENTAEFRVRCLKGYELHVRCRALHELSRVVNDTLRTSVPSILMVRLVLMSQSIIEQRPFEQGRLAVAISWFDPGEVFRAKARAVLRRLHSQGQLEILRWSLLSWSRQRI